MGMAAALCALALGAAAAEQNSVTERTREASAANVFGAPHANACAAAATSGRADVEALDHCGKALTVEGLSRANRGLIYINRGAMYLRLGKGADALADFDTALETSPKNAEAQMNRGAALVMVGKPGLAVGAFTTALQLGVREPHKAYFNRANAREALGDIRGAYEDYNTALAIKPDWELVEGELARFAKVRRDRLAAALGDSAPAAATSQQQ
jgi:tetratricopeptide (TPR) repeat protein